MLSAALLWALWPQSAIKDPWDSNAERDQFEVRWASGCAVATSSLARSLPCYSQVASLSRSPCARCH